MPENYYLRTRCRMCDGTDLVKVMSLAPTPPGNNFLKQSELENPEPRYPLDLYFCNGCNHVQLGHVVDPKILFQNNYPYVSATSSLFVKHLQDYASDMVKKFGIKQGSLISDIGSNDGTCLRFFKDKGMKVLGVDPAVSIAETATKAGIETVRDFFSFALAQTMREKYGPAAFITSHNACAHIDHLDDVVHGVSHWLKDDGVFVVEVGYLVDVYSNLWFDTIYHEHLDYHTVGPFKKLFARMGMEIISVQRVSPQGGSIRVMVQKVGGPYIVDDTVQALINLEHKMELDIPATFKRFSQRIETVGMQLRTLMRTLKSQNKTIAAFGATTKGTTLLSSLGVGADSLDFIVDDNPLKQGLFSPMFHIPVFPADELYRKRPDYVLILAWNFAQPIMAKHQSYVEQGGRFILPMPEPRIV